MPIANAFCVRFVRELANPNVEYHIAISSKLQIPQGRADPLGLPNPLPHPGGATLYTLLRGLSSHPISQRSAEKEKAALSLKHDQSLP